MPQYSLFDDGAQVLLDDATGRIVLDSQVIPAELAARWFSWLRANVEWKEGRRVMYEREVAVPRLRGHYATRDSGLPDVLHQAPAAVKRVVDAPFDSIGLNLYRDQHDSVAPHNDTLTELVRGQPIALLSLGDTRALTIRAKLPPRRVLHVDMDAGSVLSMSWDTQLNFDHGIPKQRAPCGPRISLAFRVRGQSA